MRVLGLLLALGLLAACTGSDPVQQAAPSPAPPPQPAPEPEVDETALNCMALAVYHEARGEGRRAMEAVAHVVMNRAESSQHPDDVCGVVQEGGETPPCQFSWWCDGRSDQPHEDDAWGRAQDVALDVLTYESEDPTAGATFFFSGEEPYWASSFEETTRVGGHVFMRE